MLPESPPVPVPSATISNKRLLTRMTTTTTTTTAAAASVKLLQLTQTRTHRHTHAWTRTDMYTLCGHLLPFLKGPKPDRAPRGAAQEGGGKRRVGSVCFLGYSKKEIVKEGERRNAMPSHRHKPDTPCPAPSLGDSSGAGQ